MKSLFALLSIISILSSCTRRSQETDVEMVPKNALTGTVWKRYEFKDPEKNSEVSSYLWFMTRSQVEYSSKNDKMEHLISPIVKSYTYDSQKVEYVIEGYHYTGTVSGDSLTIVGTAGYLYYKRFQ